MKLANPFVVAVEDANDFLVSHRYQTNVFINARSCDQKRVLNFSYVHDDICVNA